MTREEAKLLLQVCRPGGRDLADPRMAEAMEWLKADPELAAWFAREQDFDRSIAAGLRSVAAPPNLKTAILAGGKVLDQLVWWRLVNWARVATVAVVLLTGAGFFLFSLNRTQGIITASREAIHLAEARAGSLPFQSGDMEKIRSFLARCHAPADFQLPPGLRQQEVLGCALVGIQEQTVAVISFRMRDKSIFNLLVMNPVQDDALPREGGMRVLEQEDWTAIVWNSQGKIYFLAGKATPESLRRLLI